MLFDSLFVFGGRGGGAADFVGVGCCVVALEVGARSKVVLISSSKGFVLTARLLSFEIFALFERFMLDFVVDEDDDGFASKSSSKGFIL